MNILILSNKPPYPPKDGSSLATLNMIKGLAASGHKISLLAITTQKHRSRIDKIPMELRSIVDFNYININTQTSILKGLFNLLFSRFPYNIERFIDRNYKKKLEAIICSNKFDLIQLEGLYLVPYIKTIRQATSTNIAYRSHNIEHEIWQRISKNESNWIKSWYYSLLSKRIRSMELGIKHQVDALVAISKRDEQWFLSNGFDKPSITIPSGYSTSESTQPSGIDNNDICFLGSLDWIPNQEGLIWFLNEVWPKVQETYPDLKFHIAGRNAPLSLFEQVSKIKSVIFHGEVENAEDYLKEFSILVVPILSGSGMRVKIVEGMMLGKAIVTTTIGIEGIDADNREQVLIADKPEEFANSIIEIVQKPELKLALIDKARIFAFKQFNNNELTSVLVDFYKKII